MQIRKIPNLEKCNIIFIPESNLGFEALWVSRELKHSGLNNIYIMNEDDNRAGVRMNAELKSNMAILLNEKLRTRSIKLYNKFITVGDEKSNTPDKDGRKKDVAQLMIKDLFNQLLNYSRIIKPNKDPHKPPTEFYRGKDGYGYDDHVIALQLIAVMINRFKTSPTYKHLQ